MTHQKIISLIQELRLVFDIVRLVDVTNNTQYTLNDSGELEPSPYKCYTVWNRNHVCSNCISARACCNGGSNRLEKFEVIGHEVCHVISMRIDVDQKPFALELVAYIQEDSIFGIDGKEDFARSLTDYIQQIYADPLTNAYNRRYYTEHYLTGTDNPAVAMIDVDHFKEINDTYGHMAGDAVLQRIVQTLKSSVRSTDYVIRFGGDEFLVIFGGDIPTNIFTDKLERFRQDVSHISLEKYPALHPTISIGGIYSHDPATDKLDEADHMLYEAKRQRNRVKVRIEK